MKVATIFSGLLLIFAAGCFTETRTFTLSVRNQLPEPVSVCVTKLYSPDERGWESPEDLIEPPHPPTDQIPPGAVIQPGKTANRGTFTGTFDREHGRAILRVYAGMPTLTEMTAIGEASINRVDVPLETGPNRFVIDRAENGKLTAVRVNGPWPATQP